MLNVQCLKCGNVFPRSVAEHNKTLMYAPVSGSCPCGGSLQVYSDRFIIQLELFPVQPSK